jgi:hypothetical protein
MPSQEVKELMQQMFAEEVERVTKRLQERIETHREDVNTACYYCLKNPEEGTNTRALRRLGERYPEAFSELREYVHNHTIPGGDRFRRAVSTILQFLRI